MPSNEVYKKFKKGELHSGGPKGPVVTNPKQEIAIYLSEKKNEAAHGGNYVSSGERHNPLAGKRRKK